MGTRRPNHPDPSTYSHMRSNAAISPVHPAPVSAFSPPPPPSARPSLSRASGSHVDGHTSHGPPRASLRSQYSASKLRGVYERGDVRASGPSPQPVPQYSLPARSRSASQPSAYVPKAAPPPMPTNNPWADRSQSSLGESRRGSGSSQSTGPDSSDYSPHSGSPITPYGSSDSSLTGTQQRNHVYEKMATSTAESIQLAVPVKIKVHFHEDIFVIQVPRSTEYEELVERVGKKIRLCGSRRDDGPLRVRYKDEDGDLVSLGSTEDVQMAFESVRPGSQVTLHVL